MRRSLILLPLVVACMDNQPIDATSCAEICAQQTAATPEGTDAPAAVGTTLTPFERGVLSELVEDVRAGVRPFDDASLGVCPKGDNPRRCGEMLGSNPGELPPGEYILYGSFRAPNAGPRGTWSVELAVDCAVSRTLPDGSVKTDKIPTFTKSYEVVYAGVSKGYTLSPLRRITSPGKRGAESCTYTVRTPKGDEANEYTGGWSVPAGS